MSQVLQSYLASCRDKSLLDKPWRIAWRAGRTGLDWFSEPLTEQEAKTTVRHISAAVIYRQLDITAKAEPIPPESAP